MSCKTITKITKNPHCNECNDELEYCDEDDCTHHFDDFAEDTTIMCVYHRADPNEHFCKKCVKEILRSKQ